LGHGEKISFFKKGHELLAREPRKKGSGTPGKDFTNLGEGGGRSPKRECLSGMGNTIS